MSRAAPRVGLSIGSSYLAVNSNKLDKIGYFAKIGTSEVSVISNETYLGITSYFYSVWVPSFEPSEPSNPRIPWVEDLESEG